MFSLTKFKLNVLVFVLKKYFFLPWKRIITTTL